MNWIFRKRVVLAGIAFTLMSLPACTATELSNVKKDPTYDPRVMKHIFVVAVLKTERAQKMLEDEFVQQLKNNGRDAVASYTIVPHDHKLDSETWKSLIRAHGWDTVVISRLVKMDESEKDIGMKVVPQGNAGSGYGYYGTPYTSEYQPSSYVREQTAFIETKVFDVTSDREVWSVQSKTKIEWGGDPVPQIHKFVKTLINQARRP